MLVPSVSHANIEQIKIGRTCVSDLLNLLSGKFVTRDCSKIHLRAPEELKTYLKNLSTMRDVFDKSHYVVLK